MGNDRMAENTSGTISVVIPSYNGIDYIADCLNSLNGQHRRADEIILVDDGSTDGTAPFVEESFPEVILARLNTNRGFAAAVNEGIRRSKGAYIALLNNDTRADPEWLVELEKTLDGHPEVGSCSSKMLYADRPNVINSIGIGFGPNGTAHDIGQGREDGPAFQRLRPIFGACAGAAMYRRKLFDDIGLFDEDLFMWYEDADLSFRAQLAGYQCLYVPTAIVHHIGGGTFNSQDELHIRYCSRNQILLLAKNLPGPLRVRYFSRLALACLKHSFKTLLKGQTAVTRGYLAALKDLNLFLKKYRLSSSNTVTSADYIERLMKLTVEENDF